MKRIAFFIPDLKGGWLGGVNYIRNLLWAIDSIPQRDFEVVIFVGRNVNLGAVGDIPSFPIVRASLLDRMSISWLARKVVECVTNTDLLFERLLRKHDVSLFSHGHALGKRSEISTIGWIPDFQHRHLPSFFSEKECALRDRAYENLLENCDRVVVSSETAYQDVVNFYPAYTDRVSILHFSVRFPDPSTICSVKTLQELYGFSGEYVYIPNQFWIHKNHAVIIDALAAMGEAAPLCLLTGSTHDYRHPEHFSMLMNKARAAGVEECFRVLGVVPYEHVLSLMAHSRFVLNPSLFEGWSTTVEEAKAMGKPLLLSDIPVHREQSPEGTAFFAPGAPEELAAALKGMSHKFPKAVVSGDSTLADEAFCKYGKTYRAVISPLLDLPMEDNRAP